MAKNRIRESKKDIVFNTINYILLSLVLIVVAVPLLNVLFQSISSADAVYAGKVLFFPVRPTLAAYEKITKASSILNGFVNSFLYTGLFIVLSVSLTVMAAYPLSRKDLYGKGFLMGVFTFTMLFSGGLIPTYLLIRKLNMIDSMWALILPSSVGAWNIILARTFFRNTIPVELYEASELDGCSDLGTFFSIVLPLSKPILAVIMLYSGVWLWNSYFDALIYLQSASKYPLQLVLRNILISSSLQGQLASSGTGDMGSTMAEVEVLRYAVIVFSSIPVMILYPFVQQFFTKGIMIGSLKG